MSNYHSTKLVSRHGYSDAAGVADSAKDLLGKMWGFVSGGEKAKGQAELLKQQQAAQATQSGMPSWLLPAAVAGVAIYLYTRKKK